MALLNKFDINSDFTQFYLWGLILMIAFTVLLTWVAPRGGRKDRSRTKVDDRFKSIDGELID